MNYALFSSYVQEVTDEIVSRFGVPRKEVESAMIRLERECILAEASARSEMQFLLDFRRLGASTLADRLGVSRQAVQERRTKLLKKQAPLVAQLAE